MIRFRSFRLRSFARDRSGVTVLEFALSAPFTLMMLLGIIEFGRAIFTYGMMLFAAEEATRWAIVNYDATPSQIEARAAAAIDLAILKENATIVATNPIDPASQTRNVSVTVTYDFQASLPFVNVGQIPLTAVSEGFISEQ